MMGNSAERCRCLTVTVKGTFLSGAATFGRPTLFFFIKAKIYFLYLK
jgi:hypothetical protein